MPQLGAGVGPGRMPSGGSRRVDVRVHGWIDHFRRRKVVKKLVRKLVNWSILRRARAAARHLLDLMERSADCEAAQRGSVSKAVKLRSDPRSEAKRHFLLQEKRQPSTRSVAKELLTADGNAARNKTHAELQKKVRANGRTVRCAIFKA